MIMRVLIPLDGSKLAGQVIPHLLRFASPERSEFLLMTAWSSSILSLLNKQTGQIVASNGRDASKQVYTVSKQLSQMGYKVVNQFLPGKPAESILRLAEEAYVDLIAMSTHGRTGLGLMLLGSVAEEVLRNACPPIFLVPPGAALKSSPSPRTILLPLDGSLLAETAIPVATQFAQYTGALIQLIRVIESHDPQINMTNDATTIDLSCTEEQPIIRQATYYLERMKLRLQLAGIESRTQVAVGDPAGTIARIIHTENIDLVVMSTHGRSGVERIVHGSVVSKVISHAICPLLLMRGKVSVDVYERGGDAQLVTAFN